MSNGKLLSLGITHHVRDHCLCLQVQRAARALARRFDEALRRIGITQGQFSLLMSLNQPEPPSMGKVAAFLAVDRTTLTANIKPLERRGLLKVKVDGRDRRNRRLQLTPTGHRLLIEAMPIWTRTHADVDRLLRDHDANALRVMLELLS
jgi:DNA-binding MarR family transcriptional regulator